MKLRSAFVVAGLLVAGISANGDLIVIDSFTCGDTVTQTGLGDTNSAVSCSSAIGGLRQDTIFVTGGSGSSVSSLDSNPPVGEITGTIGSGLSGSDVLIWGLQSGVYDLPSLDLSGDSLLVQIESDTGNCPEPRS